MSSNEMRTLWTGRELKKATRGAWLGDPAPEDWKQLRVSYDIRGLRPGNLVVCMAPSTWGSHVRDTSPKLAELAKNGAAGAVVQRDQLAKLPKVPKGFPVMVVRDTMRALQDMATASRRRFAGSTVAITGTVGKTTSREMLLHVGRLQGGATGTRANNNNLAGVARTMAYVPRDDRWAAIEMGFGRPIDGIAKSSKVVTPSIALLTNVSDAHLDMFSAAEIEAKSGAQLVLESKMRIIDGMNQDGIAVFHRDLPHYEIAAAYCKERKIRLLSFGEHPEADVRLTDLQLEATRSSVKAEFEGREVAFDLLVAGKHMAINVLGILACIHAGKGDVDQAARDIGTFEAVAGRARILEVPFGGGSIHLIDDSFNATPSSVDSTLGLLDLAPVGAGGRRVAVLGEIGHLGPHEVQIHRDLSQIIAAHDVDMVLTWGPLMKHLNEVLPVDKRGEHCETVPSLYRAVREYLKAGDAITVKSGRGQGGLGDKRFRQFIRAFKDNAPFMPHQG